MASSRWVGIAAEQVLGTLIQTAGYSGTNHGRVVGLDSDTLDSKPIQNFIVRSGKSQPVASHGYGIPSTGDIKVLATGPADLLLWLRGFMGLENYSFGINTPVTGVGQHIWAGFSNKPMDGSAGGILATESILLNYDVNQTQFPGCWFNSWVIRQDIGNALESTFGVIGSTTLPTKITGDGTQAPPQQRGFGNYDPNQPNAVTGTGSWDILNAYTGGVSFKSIVKTFEMRIERAYEPNLFTSGSLLTLSNQSPGPTKITGTITIDKSELAGANSIIADALARTERGMQIVWNGDIITGTTRSYLSLQIQNMVWSPGGGWPHMRSQRTPPGYEGAFTFEAYEATSPGFNVTVYGENTTIV